MGVVSSIGHEIPAGAVSVRDFGAVGDGQTNDTAAINNALATGKPVLIPGGIYYVTGTLTPQSGQTVFGYGAEIKVDQSFMAGEIDASRIKWSEPINPVFGGNVSDVQVHGLTIRAEATGSGSGGDLSKVQAFFFGNADNYYSAQAGSSNITLIDTGVEGAGKLGYGFVGKVNGLRIEGGHFQDTYQHAIIIPKSTDVDLVGNHFEYIGVSRPASGDWPDPTSVWNNVNAVKAYDVTDGYFADNTVEVVGGGAFQVRAWSGDVTKVVFDGNYIAAAGNAGIECIRGTNGAGGNLEDVTIHGNTILGTGSAPGSRGHPGIYCGNKEWKPTIRVKDVEITDNTVNYLAPYEWFDDKITYTTPPWQAGLGTLNSEKGTGAPSGNNYHSGIELSQNGTGVEGAVIQGNTVEYFPVAGIFSQGSRNVLIDDNHLSWNGWGRDHGNNPWWGATSSAIALDKSVNVTITNNEIDHHAAGANNSAAYSPFRPMGSGINISDNIVDNDGLPIHGASTWAWFYGVTPNNFSLAGVTYSYSAMVGNNEINNIDNGDAPAVSNTFDITWEEPVDGPDEPDDGLGTSGNDHLIGDAANTVLEGLAGNDRLDGLGGNDSLFGGAGDDTLLGQVGDDFIDGGADYDRVWFGGPFADFAISFSGTTGFFEYIGANPSFAGTDTIVNVERFGFSDSNYSVGELIDMFGVP
jgi:hypothetical protein